MLRVVLIDDDPISTFITENLILKNVSEPVTFFKYTCAKSALNEFSDLGANYLFLDLNMPEMDGWSFLDSLNKEENKTEIFILTSSVDQRDIIKASKYDLVKEFFSKPLLKKNINSIFN